MGGGDDLFGVARLAQRIAVEADIESQARAEEMCFRLIEAEKSQHPVCLLGRVLGVSRAGYRTDKLSQRRGMGNPSASGRCRRD